MSHDREAGFRHQRLGRVRSSACRPASIDCLPSVRHTRRTASEIECEWPNRQAACICGQRQARRPRSGHRAFGHNKTRCLWPNAPSITFCQPALMEKTRFRTSHHERIPARRIGSGHQFDHRLGQWVGCRSRRGSGMVGVVIGNRRARAPGRRSNSWLAQEDAVHAVPVEIAGQGLDARLHAPQVDPSGESASCALMPCHAGLARIESPRDGNRRCRASFPVLLIERG